MVIEYKVPTPCDCLKLTVIFLVLFLAHTGMLLADDCEPSSTGSFWDCNHEGENGETSLWLSVSSAQSVKKFMIRSGFSQSSAEVSALDNVIGFAGDTPLRLLLSPEKGSDINEDCSLYDEEGNGVGDFVFEKWLIDDKSCGDVKHLVGLYLNALKENENLSRLMGRDFDFEVAESSFKLDLLAADFSSEPEAEQRNWKEIGGDLISSGHVVENIDLVDIRRVGIPETGGRFVDLDTFSTVALISGSKPARALYEATSLPFKEDAAVFLQGASTESAKQKWEEAYTSGKWVFIDPSLKLYSGANLDQTINEMIQVIMSRKDLVHLFLEYSYLDYPDILGRGN